MNSKRDLVKVCMNCKEIVINPKLDKNKNEICEKCKKLVEQYNKKHSVKVVINNE